MPTNVYDSTSRTTYFQAATEKLDAPSNLLKLRREIARIYTIQHERAADAAKKTKKA